MDILTQLCMPVHTSVMDIYVCLFFVVFESLYNSIVIDQPVIMF